MIIEHLEPRLSRWLLLEYEHATKYDRIVFTNVKNQSDLKMLRRLNASARDKSVADLVRNGELVRSQLVVLDPAAKKLLTKDDAERFSHIIVGGILGDYPPRGRTKELLTSKLKGVETRNIGKLQFSIDGAVVVADAIRRGKIWGAVDQPILKIREGHETKLHYAVPVVEGKMIFTPGLLRYLSER